MLKITFRMTFRGRPFHFIIITPTQAMHGDEKPTSLTAAGAADAGGSYIIFLQQTTKFKKRIYIIKLATYYCWSSSSRLCVAEIPKSKCRRGLRRVRVVILVLVRTRRRRQRRLRSLAAAAAAARQQEKKRMLRAHGREHSFNAEVAE